MFKITGNVIMTKDYRTPNIDLSTKSGKFFIDIHYCNVLNDKYVILAVL